jgi:hypothetical protein
MSCRDFDYTMVFTHHTLPLRPAPSLPTVVLLPPELDPHVYAYRSANNSLPY